jgi:hypothetical protein
MHYLPFLFYFCGALAPLTTLYYMRLSLVKSKWQVEVTSAFLELILSSLVVVLLLGIVLKQVLYRGVLPPSYAPPSLFTSLYNEDLTLVKSKREEDFNSPPPLSTHQHLNSHTPSYLSPHPLLHNSPSILSCMEYHICRIPK